MALSTDFYVNIVGTVIESLGLILTTWRIYFRLKIGRFWWEDAWAAIMLATGVVWIISFWMNSYENGLAYIVVSWICSVGFNCIVTSARMSVLYSIIRIIHKSRRLLLFTYGCAAFFMASWLIQVVQKIWQCASNPSWHFGQFAWSKSFCLVNRAITIFEFITDCLSVLILVVLPLCMLWKIRLPRRQKRMILSIFATSLVLAVGAFYHTIGQIMGSYMVMNVGFHVEIALSIIVCNLLVAVTYTCRFLLCDVEETTESVEGSPMGMDDDFTTRLERRRTTATTLPPLTTVNLSIAPTTNTGPSQARSAPY